MPAVPVAAVNMAVNDLIYLHQLQAFLVLIQLNLMEADLLLLAIEIWMGTRVKLYRID